MTETVAQDHDIARRRNLLSRIANMASIAVGILLVVRLFRMIDRLAIDVLFWDQYGYYTAVWNGASNWRLFRYQHGPHRMGIGFPIMHAIDQLTDWNQRVQAFVVGLTMCLACAAALWVKRRITGSLKWYDIAIPLVFLTNLQWELYASCINLSHGAMPLLLVMLIALCWTIRWSMLRYPLMGALTFLATFTGFGIFAAAAVLGMLVVRAGLVIYREGVRKGRGELLSILAGLMICGLGIWNFLSDYVFEPAVPGFVFPHPRPIEYLYFMVLQLAYVLGAKTDGPGEIVYGIILLVAMLAGLTLAALAILRGEREYRPAGYVICFLLAFSLLFAANSAVGRVCTGLNNALTSRYVPLLMPGVVGMYLAAIRLPWPKPRTALVGLLLAIVTISSFRSPNRRMVRHYVEGKKAWLAAYKQTKSIHLADVQSGFQIFPDSINYPIKQRLDWMEERKLSLFRE